MNIFSGMFNLHVKVEYLFFIGSQLVALSPSGKLGVWHAMTQHWQTQDVVSIASFDTAGSILLLGCNNGCIYYIGRCLTEFKIKLCYMLNLCIDFFRYAKISFENERQRPFGHRAVQRPQ